MAASATSGPNDRTIQHVALPTAAPKSAPLGKPPGAVKQLPAASSMTVAQKAAGVAAGVLSSIARGTGALLTEADVVCLPSALLYGASKTVEKGSALLRASLSFIRRTDMVRHATNEVVSYSQERLRQIQDRREMVSDAVQAAGDATKVGTTVLKQAANFIPGARSALDAVDLVVDAAQAADRIEKRAERENLRGFSFNVKLFGKFLSEGARHVIPKVIGVCETVLGVVESGAGSTAEWAKYQFLHPEMASLGNALTNLADAIDSRRWVLSNSFERSDSAQNLEAFLALPEEDQRLILTLCEHALKAADKAKVAAILGKKNVSADERAELSRLIDTFKKLPTSEKNRVTKENYAALPTSQKIIYLRLIEQHAETLSIEEKKLFEKHREKLHAGSFETLDPATKEAFQKIVTAHFHALPDAVRRLKDLPQLEQLLALNEKNEDERGVLADFLNAVEKHVKPLKKESAEYAALKAAFEKATGAPKEKARKQFYEFALKQYEAAVNASQDILLEAATLRRLLDKDVVSLIGKISKEAEGALPTDLTGAPKVSADVDRSLVHDKIGAHVTENSGYKALQKMPGGLLAVIPEALGSLGGGMLDGAGRMVASSAFTGGLKALASGVELASTFPMTVSYVRDRLIQSGIPVEAIDEAMRLAPLKVVEAGLSLMNPLIEYPAAAAAFLKERALFLLTVAKDQELAKTASAAGTSAKQAASSFLAAQTQLQKTVGSFCSPHEKAFACSNDVRLFLTRPRALQQLSEKCGKSISELWQYMGEYGTLPSYAEQAARTIQTNFASSHLPSYSVTVAEQCYNTIQVLENALKAPELAKMVESVPKEEAGVVQAALTKTTELLSQLLQWTTEAISGAAESAGKSKILNPLGKGAQLVGEAVYDVAAPLASAAAQKGAQIVAGAQKIGASVLAAGQDAAERLSGMKQEIPDALASHFEGFKQAETALKEAQNKEKLALEAVERLAELNKLWYGVFAQYAASKKEALLYYTEKVAPAVQSLAVGLRAATKIAEANKEFFKAQLAVEEYTKSFEEYQGTVGAMEAMTSGTAGVTEATWGSMKGAWNFATPFAGLATTMGETGFVLPVLMRRVVPSVLREVASRAPELQASLHQTGESARALGKAGASAIDRLTTQTVGAALYTRVFMPSDFVDPLRVANFKALDKKEQTYLFDLALQKLPESDVLHATIKSARKILQEGNQLQLKANEALLNQAIEKTLKLYDKLQWEEVYSLTAAEFTRLDVPSQQRIMAVIEKNGRLSNDDKIKINAYFKNEEAGIEAPQIIAQKFGTLSESQRNEVHAVTYGDYISLPEAAQHDLHFMIAHSGYCREFINTLTHTEPGDPTRGIKAERALATVSKATLEKEILPFIHLIPEETRAAILTPNQLQHMGQAKIKQLYTDVVMHYGAAALQKFNQGLSSFDDIRGLEKYFKVAPKTEIEQKHYSRLVANLASLFNQLSSHQKLSFYSMKDDEYAHLGKEKQRELVKFLMGQSGLQNQMELLRNELAALERGESVEPKKIVALFNGLRGEERRAFYQLFELRAISQSAYAKACVVELDKVKIKLDVIAKRLAKKKESVLPELQWQIDVGAQKRTLQEIESALKQNLAPGEQKKLELRRAFVEKSIQEAQKNEKRNKALLDVVTKEIAEFMKLEHQLKAEKLGLERLLGVSKKPFDPYELPANPPVAKKVEDALNTHFEGEKVKHQKDLEGSLLLPQAEFNQKTGAVDRDIQTSIAVRKAQLAESTKRLESLKAQLSAKPPSGLEDVQHLLEVEYLHMTRIPNLKFLVGKYEERQRAWDGEKAIAAGKNREHQQRAADVAPPTHIRQRLGGDSPQTKG